MRNSSQLRSRVLGGRSFAIALCSSIFLNIWTCELPAQVIRVDLTTVTSIGPPGGHISVLSSGIPPEYVLPDELRSNARFFRLDHGVLVASDESGQWLMFDSDDDKIFSDSDPRFFFANDARELTVVFANVSPRVSMPDPDREMPSSSPEKKPRVDSVRFSIQRKPDLPDSLLDLTMDDQGNLLERPARAWALLTSDSSFHGKAGTFYFTDWLTARKGVLSVGGHAIDIGISLRSHSNSFADSSSHLLVDANGDHKFNVLNDQEHIPLYQSFPLANKYFKAKKVDIQGRWVELAEIDSSAAKAEVARRINKTPKVRGVIIADSSIKQLTLTSVSGERIRLDSLSDRAVLLHFWGEWCAPCVKEIPTLVEAYSKYGQRDLSIIGLLKTEDLEKALALAASHDMNWPQVRVTDSLARYFSIMLYPTNLLILPGGEFVVRTSTVTPEFFDRHLARKLW